MSDSSYWERISITRRRALRGAAALGGGIAALGLVGCGSSHSSGNMSKDKAGAAIDPTKGKPGGLLRTQANSYPQGFDPVTSTSNSQFASYAHASLLQFRHGKAHSQVDAADLSIEPELARTMPEQPDETTYIFKLRDARFHNGRTLTSEDVRYSLDRYANWEKSGSKASWTWLDKVETPDATTAVVKSRTPFADALISVVNYQTFILAKEHEEGPDASKKVLGAGPFIFAETTAPLSMRFKKNPDYFDKPYPYFDELEILGSSDDSKRMADLVSGQTNSSYNFSTALRNEVRKGRPDLTEWPALSASYSVHLRVDQAPFNDKRVRQALSMTIDRKAVREGTDCGDASESDQYLSYTQTFWGFRKPADMPENLARYWRLDPQTAMQLLRASGVTLPIVADFSHWNGAVIGQVFPDTATLAASKWRELGIARFKQIEQTAGQASNTTALGNYDGIYLAPSGIANTPIFGITARTNFFSPPEGVKVPTPNTGRINDRTLSDLSEKQLTQLKVDERKGTFRQMEELLAEEQYKIPFSTHVNFYFTDPNLRNAQIPKYHFGGSRSYQRYWWWDKTP